tara:strand:+ start:11 stop:877 length:867 start_codon:yes stop_codon:yes gene_type:complete
MSDVKLASLPGRGVLRIDGEDRVAFLQGLVSNDVSRVGAERAIYAALLTPQGKFLHDFFIAASGDSLLIDCEGERRDDLFRRLRMYRLRSKVELTDVTDEQTVHVAFGDGAPGLAGENPSAGQTTPNGDGICFVDPRLARAGLRYILPAGTAPDTGSLSVTGATADEYDRWRLSLGLPDGSRDMLIEKATLLESGFEALNGVDFDKGCYMGQELTARTKYRGLVKKRLLPVRIEGDLPEPGTPVMAGDREVGEIRSGRGDLAMALVQLDALEAGEMTVGGLKLSPAEN